MNVELRNMVQLWALCVLWKEPSRHFVEIEFNKWLCFRLKDRFDKKKGMIIGAELISARNSVNLISGRAWGGSASVLIIYADKQGLKAPRSSFTKITIKYLQMG